MMADHILPGQVVVGTDSHTGTGGVLNALCLPIGVTAMANALVTRDVLIEVPRTDTINANIRNSARRLLLTLSI